MYNDITKCCTHGTIITKCTVTCRYNDVGYVSNTFVDYVSLVQGLGLADKHELLHTLDFTIPKFVINEMDRR